MASLSWVICSPYIMHHVYKDTSRVTAVFLRLQDVLGVCTDGEEVEEKLREAAVDLPAGHSPFAVLTLAREGWCDVLQTVTVDDLPSATERLARLAGE